MNERLKELRKFLDISQEEMGSRLGVTGPAISRLEKGERNITEQMILAIVREFSVNELWFRFGDGEMFDQLNRDEELAAWAGSILNPNHDNEFMKKFVHMLSKLNQDDWKTLEKMAILMAEENEKG
jgi:transcriptional regulator with XRE-family HTH domain